MLDLDFIIRIITLLSSVGAVVGLIWKHALDSRVMHKLMTNDLHHVGLDLKEIKDKVDNVVCRVNCLSERISTLEGKVSK